MPKLVPGAGAFKCWDKCCQAANCDTGSRLFLEIVFEKFGPKRFEGLG